jgi:hypothetical protein
LTLCLFDRFARAYWTSRGERRFLPALLVLINLAKPSFPSSSPKLRRRVVETPQEPAAHAAAAESEPSMSHFTPEQHSRVKQYVSRNNSSYSMQNPSMQMPVRNSRSLQDCRQANDQARVSKGPPKYFHCFLIFSLHLSSTQTRTRPPKRQMLSKVNSNDFFSSIKCCMYVFSLML